MARTPDGALFGPDTVTARVVNESVMLLGGPRALLMQLAHPKVAAGVADHSDFGSDPFGRLVRTLDAMNTIAFGTPADAAAVLDRLRRVHDRVTGTLGDGEPYEANAPDLLLWVHATLVDTVLVVERRYLGRLSGGERARYYDESRRLASAFGVPDDLVPADLEAFQAYIDDQVASLEVSDTARRLARSVLRPPLSWVPPPAWEPLRLITVDLLPRPLREAYRLGWDGRRKRLVRSSQLASRTLLPFIPSAVRNFPTNARRVVFSPV